MITEGFSPFTALLWEWPKLEFCKPNCLMEWVNGITIFISALTALGAVGKSTYKHVTPKFKVINYPTLHPTLASLSTYGLLLLTFQPLPIF